MDFMMVCLGSCPVVRQLHFTGLFHPAVLRCAGCGNQQPSGGHEDECIFISLQVESHCKDTGEPYHTVQNALLASSTETLDDKFRARCPNCDRRWTHKIQNVKTPPATLLIRIKQWSNSMGDDGRVATLRRASPMRLDETVVVEAVTYALRGVVFHSGPSPASGHYVAVVRHGLDAEPYFLYNDARRQAVPRAALHCDAQLPGPFGPEPFSATGLLYERAG